MPVIRYRTRDLTRLLPGTARTMRRMDKITGRSDDMLIIRGVNVFPSQVEEQILSVAGFDPHYQLEINKLGNLDTLTVKVELKGTVDNEASINMVAELKHRIKTMIGVSSKILIQPSGAIPRSEGKAQRVFDLRAS
jgi:phenylacetate-CoA ligase